MHKCCAHVYVCVCVCIGVHACVWACMCVPVALPVCCLVHMLSWLSSRTNWMSLVFLCPVFMVRVFWESWSYSDPPKKISSSSILLKSSLYSFHSSSLYSLVGKRGAVLSRWGLTCLHFFLSLRIFKILIPSLSLSLFLISLLWPAQYWAFLGRNGETRTHPFPFSCQLPMYCLTLLLAFWLCLL